MAEYSFDERDSNSYTSSTNLFDDDIVACTPSERTSTLVSRRLFTNPDEQRRQPLRNVSNSTELDTQRLILEELKRTNSRLDTFSEHLEALDGRLKSVEQMQLDSTTPSSSANSDS